MNSLVPEPTTMAIRLPVDALRPLLDEHGLKGTWLGLLSAHVRHSHDHLSTSILSHAEFAEAPEFEEDLLAGLSIGQQSVLYEFSLAYVDRDSRKDEGQYFTPDDVAKFMAERCKGFDSDGVWLDPCSGVGNLSHWLAASQSNPENFVRNHLVLADRDPLALFIARVLLAVSFQKGDTDLFNAIEGNFHVQDFLLGEIPQHDYVIVNPPYVGVKEDSNYITAKARDTYAYFLERIILSSRGFVSITPQSFTNGAKFSALRGLLKKNEAMGFDVYCFDNVPDSIFKGVKFGSTNTNKVNSTRAAVIVYGKTEETRRITPLLRWKTSERSELLLRADEFLSELPDAELLPKVSGGLLGLYGEASDAPTLKSVLSKAETPYKLTVPSTPRYFIPAVKRELERSSAKTVYFHSQEDLDRYYPYLNSSLLYWWWRVNDGGMTLSMETLNSLPLLGRVDEDSSDFAARLEDSERDNVVVKMNAGKPNENVKHPLGLVGELNQFFFAGYEEELLKSHANSAFAD